MGARLPAEDRFFPRYLSVSKAFKGRLTRGGEDLGAQVLDVSRDGIGVLLAVPVAKGDTLELGFGERSILFQVAHCQEDLIFKGKHRAGLRRTGSTENLVALFRVAGFLEES